MWYMSLYKQAGCFTMFHCFEIGVTSIYIGVHPGVYVTFTNHLSALNSQELTVPFSAMLADAPDRRDGDVL